MPSESLLTEDGRPLVFDLGHRGDFDYTQIAHCLAMTPTERLRHHEGWRHFVKEVAPRARLLRRGNQATDAGAG
jgi:hypothetical protein